MTAARHALAELRQHEGQLALTLQIASDLRPGSMPQRPLIAPRTMKIQGHVWEFETCPPCEGQAFASRYRCKHCSLLRLCIAAGHSIETRYGLTGRALFVPLRVWVPSCPPTQQDLLWLERMAADV